MTHRATDRATDRATHRATHRIGTREEWLAASRDLLAREKQHSRAGDHLARLRRDLPWVPVTKRYTFTTGDGPRSLRELFDGRSQLLVKHFMFGEDADAGCPSCSLTADHYDGAIAHLNARDVTLIAVSRVPLAVLAAYKQRMGWDFPWVSSLGSDFNYDYGVSFTPRQQADSADYNFRHEPHPAAELPGPERLRPSGRHRLPHLLQLRPRRRRHDQRLPTPRPRTPRPRRGRPVLPHGLGPPARRTRHTPRTGEGHRCTRPTSPPARRPTPAPTIAPPTPTRPSWW
jgi:predicted dithiol-disulfide oxidoreductase (DUF899 family)